MYWKTTLYTRTFHHTSLPVVNIFGKIQFYCSLSCHLSRCTKQAIFQLRLSLPSRVSFGGFPLLFLSLDM